MRRGSATLIVLALLAAGCGAALEPSEPFTRAEIALVGPDGQRVEMPVYVADTQAERQRGLMFREELPAGAGMIFRYPGPDLAAGGYWMRNTLIPLSIAYYGPDGKVRRVLDMEPCEADPCPIYDPGVAYAGALEVNQGFFDEVGLAEGWTVELPDDLPAPES